MRRSLFTALAFSALVLFQIAAAVPALAGEWSNSFDANADNPWTATNPDCPGVAVPLESLGGQPLILSWEVDYRYENIGYLHYFGGSAGTSVTVAAWHVAVIDTAKGSVLADYVETVSNGERVEFADVARGVDIITVVEPPFRTANMGRSGEPPQVIPAQARPGMAEWLGWVARFCEACGG